ncbi:MAG: ComEC/Rec2 family competence protein [Planctomycetia bacterium]|nr:ComEC/Rec2 family competence protein [Planctomycetia bacterium]
MSPDASRHRHYQPLLQVAAAVCLGIAIDRYTAIVYAVWWGVASAAAVLWSVCLRKRWDRSAAIVLLIGCGAVGGLRHHDRWYFFSDDDLGWSAGVEPRPIALEAIVTESPRNITSVSDQAVGSVVKSRFKIRAIRIRDDETWRGASGVADVQVDGAVEKVAAGDLVLLFGRIARPSPPLNPGEFDFAAHYRADRKLCVVRLASPEGVSVVELCSTWNLFARLSNVRSAAHAWLLRNIPTDQVGFASALLLGYRDMLDRRDNGAFFRTGTVHILSISGLHIGILALFLHGALRLGWLRPNVATAVTLGVTLSYALVIDAEPPALRAVIVVMAAAIASFARRPALGMNLLASSALIVLWLNPCDLFRVGPQLSFLAAGVLAWSAERRRKQVEVDALVKVKAETVPRWRRFIYGRWSRFGRGLVVSTAICFATTPLVAERFHILSPISLLLTPLLGIPIALALLFGFFTLTLGWLVPPLAPILGEVCGAMLRLIEFVVQRTQHWPGAALWLPGPSQAATFGFYTLLALWALWPSGGKVKPAIVFIALVGISAAMIPRRAELDDVALRCTFVSVGHGLAVVVETRDGAAWLYDCGKLGSEEGAARAISGVLWSRGITRLERIVVSHGDADHYNGLPQLLDQFSVAEICVSGNLEAGDGPAMRYIRQEATRAGVPIRAVVAGDRLSAADSIATVEMRQPSPHEHFETDNAESIVLELSAAGRRILLTGDLEGLGLERLLAQPPVDCDVVLAPHHGSARSNPPGLARWSRPEWVVVSGYVDASGAVREAYRSAGAKVLETTVAGAITATIERDGTLRIETFRH